MKIFFQGPFFCGEKTLSSAGLFPFLLLLLLVGGMDLTFSILNNGSFLGDKMLLWHQKAYGVFHIFTAWGVILFPLLLLFRLPWDFLAKLLGRRVALLWIFGVPAFAVFALLLFFDLASWQCFKATGNFANTPFFTFSLTNIRGILGLLYEQEGITPFLESVALLFFAGLAFFLPPCLSAKLPERILRASSLVILSVLLGGYACFALTLFSRGEDDGRMLVVNDFLCSIGEYQSMQLKDKVSPPLKILNDLFEKSYDPVHVSPDELESLAKSLTRRSSNGDFPDSAALASQRKYNILFLWIESLRADRLKLLGGKREVMPCLDALASNSWLFSNAYTVGSHTNIAISAPLASLYPYRGGAEDQFSSTLGFPRTNIYDILKRCGYVSGIFSSADPDWSNIKNFLASDGLDKFVHPSGKASSDAYVDPAERMASGNFQDDYTVTRACEWIRENRAQPFFAFVDFQQSHFPYLLPKDFEKKFKPYIIDFNIRYASYMKPKAAVMMNNYDNSLSYIDDQIRRLLKILRDEGLSDNTIIVVLGDHGEEFYEHGAACHGTTLNEKAIRVPMLIAGPGVSPKLDPRPVQSLDLPPTLLSLLELPPHPNFQGKNLLGDDSLANRNLFLLCNSPPFKISAVIKDGKKLVVDNTCRLERCQLYDLVTDPGEKYNRLLEMPELAQQLYSELALFHLRQKIYYRTASFRDNYYQPKPE